MWRYDGIRAGQGATLVESRQTAYDANPIVKAAPMQVHIIQYSAKNLLKEHHIIPILTHAALRTEILIINICFPLDENVKKITKLLTVFQGT